ncbi:MAG: hypothetical protein AVDCRST_MAG04-2953, partial [uncultured Acetobacteraceae bacterium]
GAVARPFDPRPVHRRLGPRGGRRHPGNLGAGAAGGRVGLRPLLAGGAPQQRVPRRLGAGDAGGRHSRHHAAHPGGHGGGDAAALRFLEGGGAVPGGGGGRAGADRPRARAGAGQRRAD